MIGEVESQLLSARLMTAFLCLVENALTFSKLPNLWIGGHSAAEVDIHVLDRGDGLPEGLFLPERRSTAR